MLQFPPTVKLAGVSFENARANIKTCGSPEGGRSALAREPGNPHDPNAIRAALLGKLFVGYVPKEVAEKLSPLMDAGRKFEARFVCLNRHPRHATLGLTVRILEAVPSAGNIQKSLKGETLL